MRGLLLAMVLGLGIAGCSDASGPEIDSNIAGAYTLRTVNDVNLPFPLFATDTEMLEILKGGITIHGDGTFAEEITARETVNAAVNEQTFTSQGIWTRINNAISLEIDTGGKMNGAVSDHTLTFLLGDLALIYRR